MSTEWKFIVSLIIGVPLAIFFTYIAIRLFSSAWFRSKKEFLLWYKHTFKDDTSPGEN